MAYRPLTDIPISLLTASSTMASGYVLKAYLTNTTTPTALYSDASGTSAGTSVTLDARGEPTTIKRAWIDTGVTYKLVLETDGGAVVWTADPVYGSPRGDATDMTVVADITGASALALERHMLSTLSLFNFGVTTASSSSAITTALQTAIDAAAAANVALKIPGGTWNLTPATDQEWEGAGDMLCAALLRNNLFLQGEADSVLRIASGVSSDGTPQQMAMFFTNSQLSNVRMSNITLDMNGDNNPISPSRPSSYNRYNQAQVMVSGTVGGVAARIDGAHFERVKFINSPGVSCILMAQSNTAAVTISTNWRIIDCDFEENGTDTDDHSSIFGWADDVVVENCRFVNSTMHGATGSTGGLAAYEVHGANHRFINNKIKNYQRMCYVAANQTSDTDNVIIAHNVASPVKTYGVTFYRESSSEATIRKVKICNNQIGLTDDSVSEDLKAGVLLASAYSIADVDIYDNLITKIGTSESSAGINLVAPTVSGQKHTNIHVWSNTVIGTCFGIYAATNATCGLGIITLEDNNWNDLDDTAAFTDVAGIAVNIVGSNTIDCLMIDNNKTTGTTNLIERGVYLEKGTITELHMGRNPVYNTTTAYEEGGSLTVTNRRGTFPTLSYTPTWNNSGTPITLGNGTVAGRYNKQNDLCYFTAELNVGSTSSFGGGALSVSLPIASITSGIKYIGECLVIDAGTGTRYQGQAVIDGTGTIAILEIDAGTFFTPTNPITLATGDELYVCMTYRVAD